MLYNIITTYVIGPTEGGIMISYGAIVGSISVAFVWLATSKIKRAIRS